LVGAAVVAESDVPGVAFEVPDVAPFAGAATVALDAVVLGATGAVAAMVVVTSVVTVAVSCGLTGLAIASPAAAWAAIFAAAAASGVVAVAAAGAEAVVAAPAAAFASILVCADEACPDAACALAAIAAAAIASGAVALPDPDAGVAAGAPAVGTATAMVTATGFGVVIDSGWATTVAAVEESEVELAPEDGLSVDLVVPDFAVLDVAVDGWVALALALAAPASGLCPVVAPPPLAELLLAFWSEAAVLREPLLSACAGLSFEAGGEDDCCGTACGGGCAVEAVWPLPASAAAVLLSTSAPKFACDGSGRADFGGAVGNDTLAAGSDVTLYTGGLSR
jgi:hypothetical protein